MDKESSRRAISTTLLTRILYAPGAEDAHTELFAELLGIDELADAFMRELLGFQMGESALRERKVETQWWNQEGQGRPDVAILAPGYFVLVENKLGAGFTQNQPGGYLTELAVWRTSNRDGVAALCIQVPESRLGTLARKTWDTLGLPLDTGFAAEAKGVGIRLISWQQTARVFGNVTLVNPVAAYLRDCLVELVRTSVVRAPLELDEERVMVINDTKVQEAMVALQDTLTQLFNKMKERGYDATPQGVTMSFNQLGFNLNKDGFRGTVGIFWPGAAHYRCSPLFLQFAFEPDDERLEAVRAEGFGILDFSIFPSRPGIWIPLEIDVNLDRDGQVDLLVEQIDLIVSLVS